MNYARKTLLISSRALSRVNSFHPRLTLVKMKLEEDINILANACGNRRYFIWSIKINQ